MSFLRDDRDFKTFLYSFLREDPETHLFLVLNLCRIYVTYPGFTGTSTAGRCEYGYTFITLAKDPLSIS
jgi:hypothetical protein